MNLFYGIRFKSGQTKISFFFRGNIFVDFYVDSNLCIFREGYIAGIQRDWKVLLTYLFNFQLLFGCGGNWVFFADSRFIFVLVSVFLVTAGWRLRSFLCLRFGHSVPRFAVAFAYFVAPRVYALL